MASPPYGVYPLLLKGPYLMLNNNMKSLDKFTSLINKNYLLVKHSSTYEQSYSGYLNVYEFKLPSGSNYNCSFLLEDELSDDEKRQTIKEFADRANINMTNQYKRDMVHFSCKQ